ncbi:jacalin-like lectin domain-containing protein [Tanacetum coccineum]
MSLPQELDRLKIPLDSIKLATNNFAQDNFLGQGGFGRVYRGQLLVSSTTRAVAVKRLDTKHGQGQKEFLMEIFMLSSYKHDNLVSLIGFCDQGGEKILVYEQEVHGSLDNYLASSDLTWEQRLRICLGAARGLDYLHSGVGEGHKVVHRDIKSSNILLDDKWEAKISDFGLSKIGPTNQEFTFLISSVAGTYGYVDPIYVETGILTKESDVYSFGIVLFEVACQRLAMAREYEDDLPKQRPTMRSIVKSLETALEHQHDGSIFSDRQIGTRSKLLGSNTGGLPWLFQLGSNQKLRKITLYAADCILSLAFTSADSNGLFQFSPQYGGGLYGYNNNRGKKIEGTRSKLLGSNTGGLPWLFQLGSNQKLRKITLYAADCILSLAFTSADSNGLFQFSPQYGGGLYGYNNNRGKKIEINFDADEEITGLTGSIGKHVSSMCVMTTKKNYGTFGRENKADNYFSDSWDAGSFDGFYGRSGWVIDAVGCCLKPTTI